jgi:hypothetical protein
LRITFDESWVGVDLTEYFRRSDCVVEHVGARGLDVKPRQAFLPDAAKLEIEGLFRVWCKLHPAANISTWGLEQAPPRSEEDVLAPWRLATVARERFGAGRRYELDLVHRLADANDRAGHAVLVGAGHAVLVGLGRVT